MSKPLWHVMCFRRSRKTSPPYRVMLHNDNFNKREYVVQVLMKVIPGMTLDNAVNIMQEAHYNGLSVVIICAQVDAEEHCMQLRGNGLLSTIEPADGGCWISSSASVYQCYWYTHVWIVHIIYSIHAVLKFKNELCWGLCCKVNE